MSDKRAGARARSFFRGLVIAVFIVALIALIFYLGQPIIKLFFNI